MSISARITAAIAAAALGLAGGGAALASPAAARSAVPAAASAHAAKRAGASPDATSLAWHPLRLINGWTAWSPSSYGIPAYAIQNGVLYLKGIVRGPHSAPTFSRLPAGARPSHYLWLNCLNVNSNLACSMEITPTGFMAASTGTSVATASLAAISFPLSS